VFVASVGHRYNRGLELTGMIKTIGLKRDPNVTLNISRLTSFGDQIEGVVNNLEAQHIVYVFLVQSLVGDFDRDLAKISIAVVNEVLRCDSTVVFVIGRSKGHSGDGV
jgi:hypothetical protein